MILGTCGSTPMHSRDCTGQDDRASSSFPPGCGPGCAEDEEEGESHYASSDCDECRTNNIDRIVNAYIVVDGVVSEIMHSADCSTSQNTSNADSPPRNGIVDTDGDKGSEKYGNRDEERQGCEAARIRNLQLRFSVGQVYGSISDEMLEAC